MKKEKILNFIKEVICWVIVIIILQSAAHKSGWTDSAIMDNVIGLTIGWLIWRAVMLILCKKSNKFHL